MVNAVQYQLCSEFEFIEEKKQLASFNTFDDSSVNYATQWSDCGNVECQSRQLSSYFIKTFFGENGAALVRIMRQMLSYSVCETVLQ